MTTITSLSCIYGYMVYKARQNSTMTQVEYASQFGISHTALIKIEKGLTSTSLDFLQEFSVITGYAFSDFQLLAEEIITDLYSKGVSVVSSAYTQSICNKLIKLHGNKFYEKNYSLPESRDLPFVLLLDSLGRIIRQDLLHKIFAMVVLNDHIEKEPKTKQLIDILKVNKISETPIVYLESPFGLS